MVVIINGEVVPDNDPRALAWQRKQTNSSSTTHQRSFERTTQQQYQTPNGPQGIQSPTTEINNKLRSLGLPDFHFGGSVIEPIYTVAAILALLFWGVSGLLIVAIAWYFLNKHQRQQPS